MSCFELPLIHCLLPSRAQPFLQNSLAWEIQGYAYLYRVSVSPGEGMLFQISVMVAVAGGEAAGRARQEKRSCTSDSLSGQHCLAAVSRHRWLAITSVLASFFPVAAAHASMIYCSTFATRLGLGGQWAGKGWRYLIPGLGGPCCWGKQGCKASLHSVAEGIGSTLLAPVQDAVMVNSPAR